MDWQTVANVLGGLLLFAYGFIFSRIISDQRELERSLEKHAGEVANQFAALPDKYVRRDDFTLSTARIEAYLSRIEAKLDSKQDKI